MTELPEGLRESLVDTAILTGDDAEPYLTDWTGDFRGEAIAILRPGNAEDVSRIMRACSEVGIAIVPQGGNTGLVGGATPVTKRPAVVVQLGRMNRIRKLDARDNSVVVEAGCVLAELQAAAATADRLFPLSLGSEGTAQIGGLVATNAGGTMALRHGMMRDLVLGIEAVLPDGRIWSDLTTLRKRNLGIDHKQLFIGAEGTTGIVTAVALKLVPRPMARATAWLALADLEAAPEFVDLAQRMTGGMVDACELIPRQGMAFAEAHVDGARPPLDPVPEWSVLLETSGPDQEILDGLLLRIFEVAMENGLVTDGAVAASVAQRNELWFLREAIVEGQRLAGPQVKHDVAVPIARVPEFIRAATAEVRAMCEGVRVSSFGHLGDGNIHFNVTFPPGVSAARVSEVVYRIVRDFEGSISAEHGLGRRKRGLLKREHSAISPFDLPKVLDRRSTMNPMDY